MEESRSQTILKREADRADRESAMMKWKLDTKERIAKEKRDNDANRVVAMMKLKIETQERLLKNREKAMGNSNTKRILSTRNSKVEGTS